MAPDPTPSAPPAPLALWNRRWFRRVLIGAGAAGALLLAAAWYVTARFFDATHIAPEALFARLFDAPAASAAHLTGEGSQWQDVHAWLGFTGSTPPLKPGWPLRPCADPQQAPAFFARELRRSMAAPGGPHDPAALDGPGWECREWTGTTPTEGLWLLSHPEHRRVYARYWRF